MKKSNFLNFAILILGGMMLLFSSCNKESANNALLAGNQQTENLLNLNQAGTTTYIVILKDNFEAATALKNISDYDQRQELMTGCLDRYLTGLGLDKNQVESVYSSVFMGFSVKLNGSQLQLLQKDTNVENIKPDLTFVLSEPIMKKGSSPAPSTQIIPWGVKLVGGPVNAANITKKAWIISTGVDLDHPDLNVNRTLSKTLVPNELNTKGNDVNGYGTCVAGVIAAKNNSIGTVGVAAGAQVVGVRVYSATDVSQVSWFIAGLDYAAANAKVGDVFCLGSTLPASLELDAKVQALGVKGFKIVMIAGYGGVLTETSPSRVDGLNLFTVTAMAEGNIWPSYSNYGPMVDYIAPGVSCLTCAIGGGYTNSTTISPAVGHVAGILLLQNVINTAGVVMGPDGNPYPIAHL